MGRVKSNCLVSFISPTEWHQTKQWKSEATKAGKTVSCRVVYTLSIQCRPIVRHSGAKSANIRHTILNALSRCYNTRPQRKRAAQQPGKAIWSKKCGQWASGTAGKRWRLQQDWTASATGHHLRTFKRSLKTFVWLVGPRRPVSER